MASAFALPSPATRDHNPAGSQMAARHSSSGRLARWQPYSFIGTNSIPNKKALPCLVRPRISLLSSSSPSALPALPEDASAPHLSTSSRPPMADSKLPAPAKPRRRPASSQLPTPLTSPPSVPPTLLQQTSSNYVLELSLAILASVYFQPAYQAPCSAVTPPTQGRGEPVPACSPPVSTPSVLSPNSIDHPLPAFRPSTTPYRAPQKEQITPLTPQSPRSDRIVPPTAPLAPVPAPSACLPPRPPGLEGDCVLPSRSDLARHLSLLGAIGSCTNPSTSTSRPPTGSMRWFLTELFKRAAIPGLIIRVAAGYVLRCRTAIAHALRSVAIKSLNPASPPERTVRERVLTDARRVFLAALVLACKFVFDKPYDNRSWSLISGLGSKDIGECERVVGEVLEWRLWIGAGRSPSCSS